MIHIDNFMNSGHTATLHNGAWMLPWNLNLQDIMNKKFGTTELVPPGDPDPNLRLVEMIAEVMGGTVRDERPPPPEFPGEVLVH